MPLDERKTDPDPWRFMLVMMCGLVPPTPATWPAERTHTIMVPHKGAGRPVGHALVPALLG